MPGVAPTRIWPAARFSTSVMAFSASATNWKMDACIVAQLFAGRRQASRRAAPRKQARSEARLQVMDMLADCRLRHQQLLRRGAKAACAHDCSKYFELVEIKHKFYLYRL